MKVNLPKKVELAKENAIKNGIIFSKNYIPPYNVVGFSTMGKTALDFSWEGEKYRTENIGHPKQFVYCVFYFNERFSGFFSSKNDAKKTRDDLNTRHFNIASLSNEKKFPVLI